MAPLLNFVASLPAVPVTSSPVVGTSSVCRSLIVNAVSSSKATFSATSSSTTFHSASSAFFGSQVAASPSLTVETHARFEIVAHSHDGPVDPRVMDLRGAIEMIDRRTELAEREIEYYKSQGMDYSRFVTGIEQLKAKRADTKALLKEIDPDCSNCSDCQAEEAALLAAAGAAIKVSAKGNGNGHHHHDHDHDHEMSEEVKAHPLYVSNVHPEMVRYLMKKIDKEIDLLQKERAELKAVVKALDPDCSNCSDCKAEEAALAAAGLAPSNGHHHHH